MAKKGKPMPIGLQRHVIKKILLNRGNTGPRKTVDGKIDWDDVSPDHDTGAIDISAVLDNIRSDCHLDENIGILESEGFLLPVPFEEMDEYRMKQLQRQQQALDEEEERMENDRVVRMMKRRYGLGLTD